MAISLILLNQGLHNFSNPKIVCFSLSFENAIFGNKVGEWVGTVSEAGPLLMLTPKLAAHQRQ